MEDLEEKKRELRELVEHFKHNVKEKQIEKYDETDTRIEFINKFFKLLGWDVDNEKKRPIEERQVVSEDKVSISGKQKSPDYGFYIKGKLRFFVEAKKPSVNIKYDVRPAFQVRRYGYSARLPISILTDFEEFAIYDTRIKPNQNDDTSVARVDYFTLDEYEEKFADLLENISPAAIEGGSFDEYTDKIKNKKGTSEVDKELLKSIESWREKLAKNITLRNDDLKLHEINLAVQKIIDRIIFLRIAEDKEIEDYETLLNATKNENIYKNLNAVFIQANKKYNAGLFMPVEYLDNLSIDDNVLKDIIKGLYYPESPYEFSVLPIEILGSIYEQFLGKTIRFRGVRGGRQTAIIEEKPEVKKAGGVYYTPQYIVRYIIEQTLLKKIKSKTPKQIKNLTVLDPACGSGSFLVQVYETLLDYYLNFYSDEKNVKQALKEEKIFEVPNTTGIKEYRLKIEEKKEILLRHIYGVDIDEQAVEVTKLSLCLKLLENESSETRNMLFRYSDLKVLPDLSNNIKSGNSLVGNDYYDNNNLILLDLEAMRKINVFDWETEFPEIFKAGGFDVILGNPPYVKEYTSREAFEGVRNHPCYQGKMDLWYLFGVKALELLKEGGLVGFIAPNNWTTNEGASLFRNYILNNAKIETYIDFGPFMVFENASIQTMIYVMQKTNNNEKYKLHYSRLNDKNSELSAVQDFLKGKKIKEATRFEATIDKSQMLNQYIDFLPSHVNEVLQKIQDGGTEYLLDSEIAQGIVPNPDVVNARNIKLISDKNIKVGDGVFVVPKGKFSALDEKEQKYIKPVFEPKDLDRFYIDQNNRLEMIYITKANYQNDAPNLINHLTPFKKIMLERRETKTGQLKWFHLHWPRDEKFFLPSPKILSVRKCPDRPIFAYSEESAYVMMAINIIKTTRCNLKFLTAVLNSKLVSFWLKHKGKMQGDNFQVDKAPLLAIPLPTATPEQQEELASLAQTMIELKKKLAEAKVSNDKRLLTQQAEGIDKEIDKLVYQLYGLNDEEIKVIEEN